MVAHFFPIVISTPVPFRRSRFKGWCFSREDPADLTPEEDQLCDFWLADGLTCFESSLLSAFHYAEKQEALHCEPLRALATRHRHAPMRAHHLARRRRSSLRGAPPRPARRESAAAA